MIRAFLVGATLLFAGTHLALAQPATDGVPIGINPPNTNVARGPQTPEQKAAADKQVEDVMRKAQEQGAAMMKMTPQQRQEAMRQLEEQMLRGTLTRSGFPDVKLQDRIYAFVAQQEQARQKVRMAANQVYLALQKRGMPADDQSMNLLLNRYLDAVEDVKDQRETATKSLDEDIKFSAQPRLVAVLTLNGIIGDASWLTGDVVLTGTMAIGSLAEIVNTPAVAP